MHVELGVGLATAVGSLPHVDPKAAAELSLRRHPSLPAIPSLPMRSPWESMLGQAIAGLDGVTISEGRIALVGSGPALDAVPETDLDHDAFGGMRAFIEVAGRRTEPVKWQVTGPVTLGLGLLHAGLPVTKAFAISEVAVTARVKSLDAALSAAFPEAPQLMVLDEPGLTGMAHPGFPLEPRHVVDLLATALGATTATAGVHCCGSTDWSVIDQAGPAVLSIPADHGAIRSGGALADFLARGGRIAWARSRPMVLGPTASTATGARSRRCGVSSSAAVAIRCACARRPSSPLSAGSLRTLSSKPIRCSASRKRSPIACSTRRSRPRFSLGA